MEFVIEYKGMSVRQTLQSDTPYSLLFPDGACYQVVVEDGANKRFKKIAPLAILAAYEDMDPVVMVEFPIQVTKMKHLAI